MSEQEYRLNRIQQNGLAVCIKHDALFCNCLPPLTEAHRNNKPKTLLAECEKIVATFNNRSDDFTITSELTNAIVALRDMLNLVREHDKMERGKSINGHEDGSKKISGYDRVCNEFLAQLPSDEPQVPDLKALKAKMDKYVTDLEGTK